MTEVELARLGLLTHPPCVPPSYVAGYYGLTWPFQEELSHDFERWRSKLKRPAPCTAENVSRYELETFMQQKKVAPKTWIAARFGMTVDSLNALLSRLPDIELRPQRYVVYDNLISESLTEDIVPNLRQLRFRTFSDQNSFCSRLHTALSEELGLAVVPLFCATSLTMEDYPRQYAYAFDCITCLPLCGKHEMWLDFHKPLHLGPDRCSRLFYAENRHHLRSLLAGTHEPNELPRYERFLRDRRNA